MRSFLVCIATIVCSYGSSSQLHSQTTAVVSATVQSSNGETATITDFSNQIGIQPTELVNVTIQFTRDEIGQPVIIDALNGGCTGVGSSIPVVGPDGTINF